MALLAVTVTGRAARETHQAHEQSAGSAAVSVSFDAEGVLWRLAASDGRLFLDRSLDAGKTFTRRIPVTAAGEKVNTAAETRPRLSLGAGGQKWVTYERARGRLYSGDVIVRRAEPGQPFSDPVAVNDNLEDIGHSYHTSALSPSGDFYVVWLDDRGGNAITAGGGRPNARGLYSAVLPSTEPLATPVNRLIAPNRVCECCRPALAFAPGGEAVLFVRLATADGLRDHASFRLGRNGLVGSGRPGPRDEWRLDGCPHHGPALAVDSAGRYHAVWFTGSDRRQGLFYAMSADEGRTFSEPVAIGRAERRAGHPDVLADGSRVWIVWTERWEGQSRLLIQSSADNGRRWTAVRQLAQSSGGVDYPFLHRARGGVIVSWFTAQDGLRIFPTE